MMNLNAFKQSLSCEWNGSIMGGSGEQCEVDKEVSAHLQSTGFSGVINYGRSMGCCCLPNTILQCWVTVFTACTSPWASSSTDVGFLECQRFSWPLEFRLKRGGRGTWRIQRVLSQSSCVRDKLYMHTDNMTVCANMSERQECSDSGHVNLNPIDFVDRTLKIFFYLYWLDVFINCR